MISIAEAMKAMNIVTSLARRLATYTNDAKTEQEYEDLLEEITLELAQEWTKFKAGPQYPAPSSHDLKKGEKDLERAFQDSASNSKRFLLVTGFYKRFDPEIYRASLGNILWSKLVHLEYPDIAFLAKLLKAVRLEPEIEVEIPVYGPSGLSRATQLAIRTTNKDVEFATRLAAQNLVTIEQAEHKGYLLVSPRGLAESMKEFAWDEWTVRFSDNLTE